MLLFFPLHGAAEELSLLEGWQDVWLFRFLVNLLGYATIIIPGYLLIRYFKRTSYLETGLTPILPCSSLLPKKPIHVDHLYLILTVCLCVFCLYYR